MSRDLDLDAYLLPRTKREKRLAQTVVYVRKIALARRDIAMGWRTRALAAEAKAEKLQGILDRLFPAPLTEKLISSSSVGISEP